MCKWKIEVSAKNTMRQHTQGKRCKRKPHSATCGGGLAQWLASRTTDQGVPGSRPGRVAVRYGLEQVTFTPCLVLVKPRKPWTYD